MIYDFEPWRGGQHARDFLGEGKGKLICGDYSDYKPSFANGVIEVGCLTTARHKFVDLHVTGKSQTAEQAIELIGQLYQVGRDAQPLSIEEHQRLDHLDYSLKCWTAGQLDSWTALTPTWMTVGSRSTTIESRT